jgi:hypothetical protein
MAEGVGGVSAWNVEHGPAGCPGVVNNDLGVSRDPVPLQGDRETVILAFVEFNEHVLVFLASVGAGLGGKPVRGGGTRLGLGFRRQG